MYLWKYLILQRFELLNSIETPVHIFKYTVQYIVHSTHSSVCSTILSYVVFSDREIDGVSNRKRAAHKQIRHLPYESLFDLLFAWVRRL